MQPTCKNQQLELSFGVSCSSLCCVFCCRYELYVKMVSQGLIQLEEQDKSTEQSEELRTGDSAAVAADTGE